MRLDPSYAAPALARALAQIESGTRGGYAPSAISPTVEQYRAPVRCHVRGINARTRIKNLALLEAWLNGRFNWASGIADPVERERFLMSSADVCHRWMISLGEEGVALERLRGLYASDLEMAALRLARAS